MFTSKDKKIQAILARHGALKQTDFDMERIALYFLHADHSDAEQVLSDGMWRDLDMDELFMFLDRSSSLIGQQYLYATLRMIQKERVVRFEKNIDFFETDEAARNSTILQLNRLTKKGAYYLQQLIFGKHIERPKWFWILPTLSNLVIVSLIMTFFIPKMFLVLLPLIIINNIIHLWNKNNLLGYSNTIPQLVILHSVVGKLLKSKVILAHTAQVTSSHDKLKKVVNMASVLKWESKMNDDMGQLFEYLLDMVYGAFLIEPIIFFRLQKVLGNRREELKDLFEAIGQVDTALSIRVLRKTLPYYCQPTFLKPDKCLQVEALYHPLITNAVSNDLTINDKKSILISGSNMSGKTTFIRSLGICTILSQTINTACSQRFELPYLKVYSDIRVNDDLLDDTSYYYAEVKRMKELLEASDGNHQCLFLLDELFKGTNTIERIASGKAVLSYLNGHDHLVFASTHDLELTEYLADSYNYYYFSEQIENGELNFDYKLKRGQLTQTNAIRILEINDFPKALTEEAQQLAAEMLAMKKP